MMVYVMCVRLMAPLLHLVVHLERTPNISILHAPINQMIPADHNVQCSLGLPLFDRLYLCGPHKLECLVEAIAFHGILAQICQHPVGQAQRVVDPFRLLLGRSPKIRIIRSRDKQMFRVVLSRKTVTAVYGEFASLVSFEVG